jgi:uncharacterized membrane protein YgcG
MNAGAGTGDLRVSDSDRDQAIARLSEHFQAGRLTMAEFDERSGVALQARTGRDLAALFTDLPPDRLATTPSAAVPAARRSGRWLPVVPIAAAVIVIAAVLGGVLSGSHNVSVHVGFGGLLPLLIVVLVIRRLTSARGGGVGGAGGFGGGRGIGGGGGFRGDGFGSGPFS